MYRKVVDMTYTMSNDMMGWPGVPVAGDTVVKAGDLASGDKYEVTTIHCSMHTGTHMDCNAHSNRVINGGNVFYTDTKDPAFFIGRGRVVDCRGKIRYGESVEIGMDVMDGVDLEGVDFLLFFMDWGRKWGTDAFWRRFPVFSRELAAYLSELPGVRGVGLETPGLDPSETDSADIHNIYLANDKTIFENLANMDRLLGVDFTFIGLPLKVKNAEGSLVRAVAVLD
jgi:kynurenine formamidase